MPYHCYMLGIWATDRSVVTTDPVALGRPFAARCRVTVPTELSATVQTILLGPEDTQLASDIGVSRAEAVFLLPSLQESDLGQYKCRSSVFSNQLNTPVMAEQSFSINSEWKWVLSNLPSLTPPLVFLPGS